MPYTDKSYRRFRESPTWKRMSAEHLASYPICERCNAQPAIKCRHKQWCHGDEWEQLNPGNVESVCAECAASAAAQDHAAYSKMVDEDGYPIDRRHPANKHR